MPMGARVGNLHVLAKAQHHAALARIDDVKSAADPDQGNDHNDQADAGPEALRGRAAGGLACTAFAAPLLCR